MAPKVDSNLVADIETLSAPSAVSGANSSAPSVQPQRAVRQAMAPKREAQTRENSSPSASQETEARLEQQDLDDEKDGHDQGRDAEANGDEEKDDEKQDEDDAQEDAKRDEDEGPYPQERPVCWDCHPQASHSGQHAPSQHALHYHYERWATERLREGKIDLFGPHFAHATS